MAVEQRCVLQEHLLFQILQEIEDIVVMQIESTPVDIGEFGEFANADIFDRLFQKKSTQTAA